MLNKDLLKEMIEKKYVNVQRHPSEDLFIYNYSKAAQFDGIWNEVTLMCRGLILDSNWNIIARPFKKFFNLEQHTPDQIPDHLTFEVYEKMDGCLGILYWDSHDNPFIATRGSFTSEQSAAANDILYRNKDLVNSFRKLDRTKTYCFEIIHPNYRIVVDYKGKKDLVLLGVIDTQTGVDVDFVDIPTSIVKRYDGVKDYRELRKLEESNKEGFIVRFSNGFRTKLKFAEYCRLHSILTNVSSKTIWRTLRGINKHGLLLKKAEDLIKKASPLIIDSPLLASKYLEKAERLKMEASLCPTKFSETLDNVPDEFYKWVELKKNLLIEDYNGLLYLMGNELQHVYNSLGDSSGNSFIAESERRKEFAEFVHSSKRYEYKRQVFALNDGKDISDTIWKMIEPKYETPFINNEKG